MGKHLFPQNEKLMFWDSSEENLTKKDCPFHSFSSLTVSLVNKQSIDIGLKLSRALYMFAPGKHHLAFKSKRMVQ